MKGRISSLLNPLTPEENDQVGKLSNAVDNPNYETEIVAQINHLEQSRHFQQIPPSEMNSQSSPQAILSNGASHQQNQVEQEVKNWVDLLQNDIITEIVHQQENKRRKIETNPAIIVNSSSLNSSPDQTAIKQTETFVIPDAFRLKTYKKSGDRELELLEYLQINCDSGRAVLLNGKGLTYVYPTKTQVDEKTGSIYITNNKMTAITFRRKYGGLPQLIINLQVHLNKCGLSFTENKTESVKNATDSLNTLLYDIDEAFKVCYLDGRPLEEDRYKEVWFKKEHPYLNQTRLKYKFDFTRKIQLPDGHIKSIVAVRQENLNKYLEKFGTMPENYMKRNEEIINIYSSSNTMPSTSVTNSINTTTSGNTTNNSNLSAEINLLYPNPITLFGNTGSQVIHVHENSSLNPSTQNKQ